MQKVNEIHEAKKGGAPNQGSLQSYIQNYTKEAIDAIVVILRTSRNESLKMGAAKLIIDKSIADKKAVELSGANGEPIKLNIIAGADYLAWLAKSNASPAGGVVQQPPEIQGVNLAQAGEENVNGNTATG